MSVWVALSFLLYATIVTAVQIRTMVHVDDLEAEIAGLRAWQDIARSNE